MLLPAARRNPMSGRGPIHADIVRTSREDPERIAGGRVHRRAQLSRTSRWAGTCGRTCRRGRRTRSTPPTRRSSSAPAAGGVRLRQQWRFRPLNAKFDEIYAEWRHLPLHDASAIHRVRARGCSDWHLKHIARKAGRVVRADGPGVCLQRLSSSRRRSRPLNKGRAKARFALSNKLDRKIFNGSLTLAFAAPASVEVFLGRQEAVRLRPART